MYCVRVIHDDYYHDNGCHPVTIVTSSIDLGLNDISVREWVTDLNTNQNGEWSIHWTKTQQDTYQNRNLSVSICRVETVNNLQNRIYPRNWRNSLLMNWYFTFIMIISTVPQTNNMFIYFICFITRISITRDLTSRVIIIGVRGSNIPLSVLWLHFSVYSLHTVF